jgi:hypothetical protein
MIVPQSPQYIPSSAIQRNWPQRSHRRGSSGSFRQTIEEGELQRTIIPAAEIPGRVHSQNEKGNPSREGKVPLGNERGYAFFIRAREMNPFLSRKYM